MVYRAHLDFLYSEHSIPSSVHQENPQSKQLGSLTVVCKGPSAVEVSSSDYSESQYDLGTIRLENLEHSQKQR